jgi:hypothetical protein
MAQRGRKSAVSKGSNSLRFHGPALIARNLSLDRFALRLVDAQRTKDRLALRAQPVEGASWRRSCGSGRRPGITLCVLAPDTAMLAGCVGKLGGGPRIF